MILTCGIYLFSKPQNKFLLCHATRSRADMWSIPKGIGEENENCFQTTIRELYEETSIDLNTLEIIHAEELPLVKYKRQAKTLQSYLIVTKTNLSKHSLKCSSFVDGRFPEVDRFLWVEFELMEKYAHESQQVNLPIIKKILDSL